MYLDSLDGGKDFLKRRCKVLTIKEKKKKGNSSRDVVNIHRGSLRH